MAVNLGRLCSDFPKMEGALQKFFDKARSWKAIIHFTEVDIVTRPSKVDDAERVKALSVFSRKIKQFDGICFMTTNRSALFDEAFKPLLDLVFHIPAPDFKERKQIWRLLLERAGKQGMPPEVGLFGVAQDMYCKIQLTGGRIANVVSASVLLAKADSATEIRQSHVERVLALTTDFDTYLKDSRGMEPWEAEIAREAEEVKRKEERIKQEREDKKLEEARWMQEERDEQERLDNFRYSRRPNR